ncbi:CocE/NonD family hydrolase [Nocardioides marmoriginsengisoli]|uniref:CocE/NonD family hydrolase n=1 Tax=Nocardioides marmoriginsengisoli TaxID=661483 RepID=A0A3N0CAL0_9ACTN|nr:CocE/NonD family hydrolase [Nocardioides marmoriginsengisoli]RNL60490.1 CocE/NonD family hydrolase [Nocardioides marmoriginsengisoli]
MHALTKLTTAAVATLALTGGSIAAVAVAKHGGSDSPASAGAPRATTETRTPAKTDRTAADAKARRGAAKGSTSRPGKAAARTGAWKARGVQYPKTVTIPNLPIKMDDGVLLRGDLILPADAAGKAIAKKFPVIVTITAYNKGVQQYAGGLAGGAPEYLVQRGYAQLTVDARGTGTSDGQWCAFCTRENRDGALVMEWAHQQPWSNGSTAMAGPSYMGIAQMFAAAGRPAGLKAIFPQVPAADVYRDVVASGGQLDVGFIPLWLGLVTGTGLIPPTTPPTDLSPLSTLVQHLAGAGNFTVPLILKAFTGGEAAFDGDFYKQRSPINVASRIQVPTFFVSGEYDLFQRGTPLLFENLAKRGVPAKMIIGPWNHLQASGGGEVGKAGLGSLDELKLRWFDHYVKGVADPSLDRDIPPITYYEQGTGAWRSASSWLGNRKAVSYRLSGTSRTASTAGALTTGAVTAGTSSVYPVPVSGLCTRSTDQWTAGLLGSFPGKNPCFTNNKLNDKSGVVFRTAPVTKAVALQGPINARLYVSSNSGDGMLSVAVEDEAPDGTVSRYTGGWQVISHRALDKSRSRYLDGQLIQPYHPFTKAAKAKLARGAIAPVDVEIFPTGGKILPGHRLRIAVQAFDVPHLSPILPDLLSTLTVIKIHNSAQYPSMLTIPVVK